MQWYLTKLSSSGSSLKKGLPSFSWLRTKFSMSTSKLAEVMHSELSVDCSHFSNSRANRGNKGCLWKVCIPNTKRDKLLTHFKGLLNSFPSNRAGLPECTNPLTKGVTGTKWSEHKLQYRLILFFLICCMFIYYTQHIENKLACCETMWLICRSWLEFKWAVWT